MKLFGEKSLSVIIITKDEEKNLERCLKSIKNLADEIIVVDCGSTDKTVKIAKEYTEKVFFRQWDSNFAEQKNYALSLTKGDWILSLDADEEITLQLLSEIKEFFRLGRDKRYSGMWLPRKNITFGRWLKHGECWPDYQLKFFKKGSYFQRAVHEVVVIDGPCGFFQEPVVHHHYKNARTFIQRARKYTDIEVKALLEEGKKASVWAVFAYPLAKFLKVYISKRGFLDGFSGFIYAGLLAYYSFLKRLKFFKEYKKNL